MKYKLVLGLEVHMHAKTSTKMFCACDANIYDKDPNTSVCPVCLGLPGALPVPNLDAVKKTQLLGLALGCKLNQDSRFDRKHYFYPDLPKGYQISQYKQPLCEGGSLTLNSGTVIEIERIHLEEDTAKSIHTQGKSLIDFNTSGMPLIELVTKPCFVSAEDASDFGRSLRDLVRHIDVCDADMQKGQMRLEPNISVRTQQMETDKELPSYKVEIKNINSFKFMERAVKYEVKRQTALLESGEVPIQENRGFDEKTGKTLSQRTKEDAKDYRYFPEPDIPPMVFSNSDFAELKAQLPELPWQIKERLVQDFNVSKKNAVFLTSGVGLTFLDKFEELLSQLPDFAADKIANLLLNRKDLQELTVTDFVKKVLGENEKIDNEDQLVQIVNEVIKENPDEFNRYKSGNDALAKFFIGQVMRKTQGKADAQVVLKLLENQ